ncbi:MAG: STN domain-containing protein [Bacteroidota bacterium]
MLTKLPFKTFCVFFKSLRFGLVMLLFFPLNGYSQQNTTQYNFSYEGTSLKSVIEDLNTNYALTFAYSSRFIPLEEPVAATANTASLEEALDEIFEPIPVTYRVVGRIIVLRPQEVKVEEITKAPTPPAVVPQEPVIERDERMEALMEARRKKWEERLPFLQKRYISSIEGRPQSEIDLSKYQLEPGDRYYEASNNFFNFRDLAQIAAQNANDATSRLAQVSLIPFLGTNSFSSYQLTNEFSVNLLWGMNGGVQGKEFGGIANTIKEDVQGVQIAGLVNTVGDDMYGTQISGLGNITKDTVQGLQIAGLFNISGYGTAIQAATLFNVAKGGFEGIQSSFLYNSITEDANAIQLSLLHNRAKGNTKFQAGILLNTAKDIKTGQVSAFMNKAEKVDGFQLGLINKSDSISGIPIGLINIVKQGYNRAEFSSSEYLTGNFALKIGVRRFYNIFIIGTRIEDVRNNQEVDIKEMSWGLGYGLGTGIKLGSRFLVNLEALSLHINEKESWTNELHQLNQFKVLMDLRIGRRMSVFGGPVCNWMISDRVDPETGIIGTSFAPETIFDETTDQRNNKVWFGWNAGLRF